MHRSMDRKPLLPLSPVARERSSVARALLVLAGCLAVVLGGLGAFLPLLPTTPFLLLAAACFMRSSERLHRWLCEHRWFGAYIQRYQRGEGIPRRARQIALLMAWTSISLTAVTFWVNGQGHLLWLPVVAGVLATFFILRIKTWPSEDGHARERR